MGQYGDGRHLTSEDSVGLARRRHDGEGGKREEVWR